MKYGVKTELMLSLRVNQHETTTSEVQTPEEYYNGTVTFNWTVSAQSSL